MHYCCYIYTHKHAHAFKNLTRTLNSIHFHHQYIPLHYFSSSSSYTLKNTLNIRIFLSTILFISRFFILRISDSHILHLRLTFSITFIVPQIEIRCESCQKCSFRSISSVIFVSQPVCTMHFKTTLSNTTHFYSLVFIYCKIHVNTHSFLQIYYRKRIDLPFIHKSQQHI